MGAKRFWPAPTAGSWACSGSSPWRRSAPFPLRLPWGWPPTTRQPAFRSSRAPVCLKPSAEVVLVAADMGVSIVPHFVVEAGNRPTGDTEVLLALGRVVAPLARCGPDLDVASLGRRFRHR